MRLHTANRRDRTAADAAHGPADDAPASRPLPGLGTQLFVELPGTVTEADVALLYTVVSLNGDGDITARPVVGATPVLRADMPCLVRPVAAPEEMFVDAFARTSHDGGLILHMDAVDARRHHRYAQSIAVAIQPPGSDGVYGTTEDISLGGVRARVPTPLPPVRRVFLSLMPAESSPIVATARMVSCERSDGPGSYLVRLEYASMATAHRARLWLLLEATAEGEAP